MKAERRSERPNRSEYQSHKEWSNTTRTPVIIYTGKRRRSDDLSFWKLAAAVLLCVVITLLFWN